MEKLLETSELLRDCLDKYTSACSFVAASYDLVTGSEGDHTSPLLIKIEQELQKAAAYENAISNAKSILSKKRNTSPALVLINALPIEVLDWIFQLACYYWTCALHLGRVNTDEEQFEDLPQEYTQYNMAIKLPSVMFPEALTHVCSRWRQVALGSQNLWSGIDLPIFSRSYKSLLRRGETFASRVSPPILDIHILTANKDILSDSMYDRLEDFYASSGSKIRSLKLTNGIKPGFTALYLQVPLQDSFPHLVPGTLQHLAVIDHYPAYRLFIKSIEGVKDSDRDRPILIELPQQRLDEILRPIQSLWLKNIFFPWESPAYCGLVDLRLLTSGSSRLGIDSIEPSQLMKILSSCLGLQIFHCELEVKAPAKNVQDPAPVYLADLEELNLRRMKPSQHEYLLPLLFPGQKPLSLSIQAPENSKVIFSTAVLDFFNRSNVVALYINRDGFLGPLLESLIMGSPGSVRILGLQGFVFNDPIISLPSLQKPHLTRLDCLNVKWCRIKVEVFRDINRVCPIQMLKTPSEEDVEELADVFPVVKCVLSSAPIEEWNSWGIREWTWRPS